MMSDQSSRIEIRLNLLDSESKIAAREKGLALENQALVSEDVECQIRK